MIRDKILVIGAAILDVLVDPAEPEVFATGSYAADRIQISTGGDALNEASVLASLGCKVELDTVIGDDMAGEILLRHCEENGIELSSSRARPDIRTGVNIVLVRENGGRCFLTDPGASLRKISPRDVSVPFADDIGILSFASIFTYPAFGPKELERLFHMAKNVGIVVCADMTSKKNNETMKDMASALRFVDYLMPNEQEAALITGAETPEKAAEIFLEAGVKNVVIKLGARGCYVRNANVEMVIPAVQGARCIDTTGAGDSFCAGFLYALSRGRALKECARYANRCGARAVSAIGATGWLGSEPGMF